MNRRQALVVLTGGAAGLAVPGARSPASACDGFPDGARWHFQVLREGSAIGEHRCRFSRQGDDGVVEITIDIAVTLLGVTLFRFIHRAEEVWREGRLQSLVTSTDDDGTLWQISAAHEGGALRGEVNGVPFALPGVVIPASLWHRDTPKMRALLDPIDGRLKAVTGRDVGAETVTVAGLAVPARHIRLTGELRRDVWYDARCAIAKVTFPARDGSLITLARG